MLNFVKKPRRCAASPTFFALFNTKFGYPKLLNSLFNRYLAPRLRRSVEKSRSDDSYCSGGFQPAINGITHLWSAVGTTHLLLTIGRTYGTPLKRVIFHRRVETRRYNIDRRYATGFAANESGLDIRGS